MTTRKCRRCHCDREFPAEFYRSARHPDGRSVICRTCELSRIKRMTRTNRTRRKPAVRTEEQIIADEAKRVAEANERAFKKLIPIEWPATRART